MRKLFLLAVLAALPLAAGAQKIVLVDRIVAVVGNGAALQRIVQIHRRVRAIGVDSQVSR